MSSTTVDEYLDKLPEPTRATLERLRAMIRKELPDAEEVISYQIPTFKLGGMVVGYGATAKHCTFFLLSAAVLQRFSDRLKSYRLGKGSIQFPPDGDLPPDLVRDMVRARVEELSTSKR
ncbi:MAG: hypothetical protein HONBIEJF_02115 [Fimbriimonadaceae bacterium]|nr:hypothetical protein [Fimbriimonadaceae bacterium]